MVGRVQDVSHASTRLTERGWAAVPELAEVHNRMVASKSSPCRILHNSQQFQNNHSDLHIDDQIFEGKSLAHQGLALHRFNACVRPMARTVFTFRAVVGEAQLVYRGRERDSRECEAMLSWAKLLQLLHILLLPMQTEGAAECIKVTRLTESEHNEIESSRACTDNFLKTCVVLFEHRKAHHLGFTKFMLQELKGRSFYSSRMITPKNFIMTT